MAINYQDERFEQVENEKNQAINKTESSYNEMISNTDSMYQQQIDASKNWADKQTEIQQAQTDFTIEKVNQAKEQAEKQYTKEQKGAYTDYTKATGQYGANAETLASQGLTNTGYAESTRTNMYNTYQNRYTAARESYNQAVLNYDNSIKEAQLANSSALATIAYEALQKQLELSLQGFQYKNQLVLQKLEAVNQQEDRYYQRWQDVQSQINTETALAEQIRQYNEKMAFEKQQAAQEQARWEKEYALSKAKASSSAKSSSGSAKLTNGSANLTNNNVSNNNGTTGALSQNGNKVYQTALTIYNSHTGSKEQSKRFAANYLADSYKRFGLDDNELKLIASKLGLD